MRASEYYMYQVLFAIFLLTMVGYFCSIDVSDGHYEYLAEIAKEDPELKPIIKQARSDNCITRGEFEEIKNVYYRNKLTKELK